MRKAIIVIPTYNEAKNVEELITKIDEVTKNLEKWLVEILIVDSNSPDKTADVIKDIQKKNKRLHLLSTPKEGLGKAYVKGFTYAIDTLKCFIVFEMDADLQHNPKLIPRFLEEIEKGADFVIGSRYVKDGSIPAAWGLHRKFLSIVGNWIIRLGFMKISITDWTSGYRAIKSWIVKETLPTMENHSGYVFQVALLDNALKLGARVSEVPQNFEDRVEGVSKLASAQTTIQTLIYVFLHSSFVKYVLVGITGFILDFGISYFLIERSRWAVWLSTLISTEIAIASNFILNNFWSFRHKKLDHSSASYLWSFLKFNLVSSGSILIQTLGVSIASYMFGQDLWYVYKVAIIVFIIIPYSYILYNKFIWKDK